MFTGQLIVGFSRSVTVTVKVEGGLTLPAASRTEHITVVMPLMKVEPEGGLQTGRPTPGQLSETLGSGKITWVLHWPVAVFSVRFGSVPISGEIVSLISTSSKPDERTVAPGV